MTEQESRPTTTSEIGNIRAQANFQAIDATFYNLTDTQGRAIAGFLVLLDRLHRPVRAELHFYEELDGFVRDNTVRQAQHLLQERYYSREPVTLRVMYTFQDRKAYDVPLQPPESAPSAAGGSKRGWQKPAAIAAAILLVVLLIWAGSRAFGGGSTGESADATPAVAEGETASQEAAAAEESADAAPSNAAVSFESQDLPPSQNAHSDLSVGMRVIIQPGLQSNILSEPNLGVGESVGVIQDGEGAQLLDGPVLRKGESDTIVWWYALTDAGVEGWIPANTSQFTLLVPAE